MDCDSSLNLETDIDYELELDFNFNEIEEDVYPFEALSRAEVTKRMFDCIERVSTIIEIPKPKTRLLLNHFKWDEDKVMDFVFNTEQLETMIQELCKISSPEDESNPSSVKILALDFQCGFCLSTSSLVESICNHQFCVNCLSTYVTDQIIEGCVEMVFCPAAECYVLIDVEMAMKFIADPQVMSRYEHLVTECFVGNNRLVKWCPMADCSNAIVVQYSKDKAVKCKCSFEFCFACEQAWHEPIDCSQLSKWREATITDAETLKWTVFTNAKPCPICKALVLKTGGCNYMLCEACKMLFCWICLCLMTKCHVCVDYLNSINDDHIRLFYYKRYVSYEQSLNLEQRLYKLMERRMEILQNRQKLLQTDVRFLVQAVDTLCRCRRIIMNCYVFEYFQRHSFNMNFQFMIQVSRKDLERAAEFLSRYLENEIFMDEFEDVKQKIRVKTSHCNDSCKRLLDCIYKSRM